jgi:hypothetical protein
VSLPWIRAGGEKQRDVAANPERLQRSALRLAWDQFTDLERLICDPSLGPGTGLAQRDRSQELPACEEASATSEPSTARGVLQLLTRVYHCDVHWFTLQDASCASLEAGQPAGSYTAR